MSKKQRRTRAQPAQPAQRGQMARTAQRAVRAPVEEQATPQPVRIARPPRAPAEQKAKEVDFAKEYHYVVQDLRKVGLFAVSLFALLIVLAVVFAVAGI